MVMPSQKFASDAEWLAYAAKFTRGALEYKRLITKYVKSLVKDKILMWRVGFPCIMTQQRDESFIKTIPRNELGAWTGLAW